MKFKYYGLNKLTGQLAWYDSWSNQNTLPVLVSISANTLQKGQIWPTLIAETKFGAYLLP